MRRWEGLLVHPLPEVLYTWDKKMRRKVVFYLLSR
jgi:hypothetical protein